MSHKIAIVNEWLTVYAGAERCLESFTNIWGDADIYALIDFLDDNDREIILKGKSANTSFIQSLPFAKTKYRNYLPLFPYAIEQFDLSAYDVVISSSHAVAKGVLTNHSQIHICYCHTPVRYAWDLYHQYLFESNFTGLKAILAKYFLHKLRIWDIASVNRVDHFIANSEYIARRIQKVYRREATVIYPPVDIQAFAFCDTKEEFYLTASRMVPYKKIDLIVEAFSSMPDKKLIVIGDGPEADKIKSKAAKNIELLGYQPFETLKNYMQKAKAFVFAAEEDFGIIPVEAQACGTPIIAYKKGGACETVKEGLTGVFFEMQTVESICKAVHVFESKYQNFEPSACRKNAEQFSKNRFETEILNFVNKRV